GKGMRIYVGGLGPSVAEDDIKKVFTSPQLGTVNSVEIIRSKSRSFAYLDFDPVSENGISKLFGKYNGCLWKGGRLRLEKAKEHYLIRLKREWDEANAEQLNVPKNDKHETAALKKQSKDFENAPPHHLNIYFPKLRKIKAIPLKGSGKHKYSFQRVEVPPMPVNFCDCEEHS
ncbi:hypothetical protein M569_08046, partial [Genlisea aurea]